MRHDDGQEPPSVADQQKPPRKHAHPEIRFHPHAKFNSLLDEVLSFRAQHLAEHRRYMRSIRKFARELAFIDTEAREAVFADRQTELDDMASDLRKLSRSAWRVPVSYGIGLAGAGWIYSTGDPMGALLAGGAILAGGVQSQKNEAGAYSYLFSAGKRFA